jgi:Family of unknown function (DUF6252)
MKTVFNFLIIGVMLSCIACKKSSDNPATPANANNNSTPPIPYGITATIGTKTENFSYCGINSGSVIVGYGTADDIVQISILLPELATGTYQLSSPSIPFCGDGELFLGTASNDTTYSTNASSYTGTAKITSVTSLGNGKFSVSGTFSFNTIQTTPSGSHIVNVTNGVITNVQTN